MFLGGQTARRKYQGRHDTCSLGRCQARRLMTLERLESRNLLAADIVFDMPATGLYELFVDGDELVIRNTAGAVLLQETASDVATLTINGTAGDDVLRIVETSDGLPQFAGNLAGGEGFQLDSFLRSGKVNAGGNQNVGLHFEAGSGDDALELLSINPHDVSYFVGASDGADPTSKRGNINVAEQFTLSFDGLTPQVIPGSGGSLIVDASSDPATTVLNVSDDATDLAGTGGMVIVGDGGFETVFFANFLSLTIIGGAGPETIELATFDPSTSLTEVTLDGDDTIGSDVSEDLFIITSLPPGITANVLGGGGDDTLLVDQSAGLVGMGDINFDGEAHVNGDVLRFTGDGSATGNIDPDGTFADAAVLNYGSNSLAFAEVEIPLIGGLSEVTYTTPNAVDEVTIEDSTDPGGSSALSISGASDVVSLATPIFTDIPSLIFDFGANDGATGADVITYDNGVPPVGITQVRLLSGAHDDMFAIGATAAGTSLVIEAGDSNDVIEVGLAGTGIEAMLGSITIGGGDHIATPETTASVTANGETVEVTLPIGDILRVNDSSSAADGQYNISDATVQRDGTAPINTGELETIELFTGQGTNAIEVSNTEASSVLRIQGGDGTDVLNITQTGAGSIFAASLLAGNDQVQVDDTGAASVMELDSGADADTLFVANLGDGSGMAGIMGDDADSVAIAATGASSVVSIVGAAGDDVVQLAANAADATTRIDGGGDDDAVRIGNGSLDAVAGEVVVVGNDGSDQLIVDDAMDNTDNQYQLDESTAARLGGTAVTIDYETVERVQLLAGLGADIISVTPAVATTFEIDGNTPTGAPGTMTGDRLIPLTDGLTGVVIPTDVTSGTIMADGVQDIDFTDIELLPEPPVVTPDGDRFEENDTIETATPLGSEPVVTLRDLTLHDDIDEDFFRITAHDTGKLIVNVLFVHDDGNIDVEILAADGNPVSPTDAGNSDDDNESIVIPVVSQQDYFIRVFSPTNETNEYSLEVENFAAPVPASVDLDPNFDTGLSFTDHVTSETRPRLLIQADLLDFANMGVPILNAADVLSANAGAGVFVSFTDTATGETQSGLANPLGLRNQLWEFAPAFELANATYTVAAGVIIVDGRQPPPASGLSQLSVPTEITSDTISPATSDPQITPSFDTGMNPTDGVTSNNELLVFGTSEANAKVRVLFDDVDAGIAAVVAGETAAGTDGSWQFALPTLSDGHYRIFTEVIDLAGNSSGPSDKFEFWIDTSAPSTARLALLSDNGRFENDHISSINKPIVAITAADASDDPAFPHDLKYRLYLLPDGSATEVLLVDSFAAAGDFVTSGTFTFTLSLSLNSAAGDPFPDGNHRLRLEVEDRAGNVSESAPLELTIDTEPPEKSFGEPLVLNDGLSADSDSGIPGTAADRITNDTTPTFWGLAEADAFLAAFVVADDGGTPLDPTDDVLQPIGQTIATAGNWQITSNVDLTDPALGFGTSGPRRIVLSAEDVAGNVTPDMTLDIFIDTAGPRITSVVYPDGRSVFDPKPTNGPSPLTNMVIVTFTDHEAVDRSELQATLNGLQEVPAVATTASGFGSVKIVGSEDNSAVNVDPALEVELFLLDINVADITGAHIHLGAPGVNGDVLVNLLAHGSFTVDGAGLRYGMTIALTEGALGLTIAEQLAAIQNGGTYFNIHTTANPGGEIRGQVTAAIDYPAVNAQLALQPSNYQLVGDANGPLLIESVAFVSPTTDGFTSSAAGLGTTFVKLTLFEPLPDDRLTLTVFDRLLDDAANALDGDFRATEPGTGDMLLPSGDGLPGADFAARFTVDARAEIGTWGAGSVYIDTNGNFVFDPQNADDTNEDIVYALGFPSDDIFAGNFVAATDGVADGFDKLAAYGDVGMSFGSLQFRWLIDVNNDGVVDPDNGDIRRADHANVNGLPVAGRFDANDTNGDEVAVFTGRVWWFDTNHDFQLDSSLTSDLRGFPIVGDFDGNGFDDLGTYNEAEDRFEFDLAADTHGSWDGSVDVVFGFGFAGVRDRPVAADFDADGIDDIGLWVPDRSGQPPAAAAEWYILVSGGAPVLNRIVTDPSLNMETVLFTPQPFGNDIFAQFGDEFALPVAGNLDPPVINVPADFPLHNALRPFDVNNDGYVSPLDALIVINTLDGEERVDGGMFIDTNRDGHVSPLDALLVINELDKAPVAALAARAAVELPNDTYSALIIPGGSTETQQLTSVRDLATDVALGSQEAMDLVGDVPRDHQRWRSERFARRTITTRVPLDAWLDDLARDVSRAAEHDGLLDLADH